MKKIISVLLTLSFVFVSGFNTTFADTSTKDSSVLLKALDIFEPSIEQRIEDGDYLTRADAAYYALKVAGFTQFKPFSKIYFNDVTAQTPNAEAINYSVDLGIISLDDTFEPSRNVTIGEFLKMVECGLGYQTFAQKFGAYPTGYMSLGVKLGFIAGGVSADEQIPYAKLCDLLTSVLMSRALESTLEGEYSLSETENVLYKVFDVKKVSGTITANAVTSLITPVGVGRNNIMIEDDLFSVEPGLYAKMSNDLGYEIYAWVNAETDTVICYEPRSTTEVITIDAEDFESLASGTLTYYVNNSTRTLNIPSTCKIIYNGKAITEDLSSDVFNQRWGNVRAVKGRDGKVKTVIITAYDDYFVSGKDASKYICYDNTTNNHSIKFSNEHDELSENAYFYDLKGNAITFGDIGTSCVVSVAQNGDYYSCIVSNSSVSGVLNNIIQEDDKRPEIQIDENRYTLSPEMDESRIMKLKPGNSYTFYIDAGGRVAAGILISSMAQDLNWVYLINTYVDNLEEEALYFRVLTPLDGVVALKGAERISVDGVTFKKNIPAVVNKLTVNGSTRQLVKIMVDDDGNVTKIDTTEFNPEEENVKESVRCINGEETRVPYCKTYINAFGTQFSYTGSTIVFVVPEADSTDAEDYSVVSPNVFISDISYKVKAYNTDKYSRNADVIVSMDKTLSETAMWRVDYLSIVSNVQTVVDDGEVKTQITCYQSGIEQKLTLANADVLKIAPNAKESYLSNPTGTIKVSKGDTIRYSLNNDREVDCIQLVFDASDRMYHQPVGIEGFSYDEIVGLDDEYGRKEIGLVIPFRIDGGQLISAVKPNLAADADGQKYITSMLSQYKIYVVEMVRNGATVKVGNVNDIHDWYNYGTDDNQMVIQNLRHDLGRDIIIYKY